MTSAPDDHFSAGPDCRVKLSARGRVGGAGGCPTVGIRRVSTAGAHIAAVAISAPDDHLAAGPHCRVSLSARGRVGGTVACPTVLAWIVSSTGIQKGGGDANRSAPDDHFTAGPHCREKVSA